MIIGLTGTNASGKGEVAKILQEHGYKYYSLSDQIREEAKKRNLEPTRENLINIGNDLRKQFGPGIWAKKLTESIKEENIIADSIRHPDEVAELKSKDNFLLIAVDAPIETRFERAKQRGRVGASTTLEDFKQKESLENTDNKNAQQLNKTLELADHTIINDSDIEHLKEKVKTLRNAMHF